MKVHQPLRKTGLLLLAFMIMLPCIHAQSRYKHVPRVKVERKVGGEAEVKETKRNTVVTMPVELAVKTIEGGIPDSLAGKQGIMEQTSVVSMAEEVMIIKNGSNLHQQHLPQVKEKARMDKDYFTQKVKKESKLLKVKEAKKTALLGYLIWFIVVLILVIALFVLAFVFLYLVAFTLYYIFLAFGIAAAVILALILIFGLLGII